MPLLGALLTSLFVGIAEFFAKWITRKVAAAAAAIAIFAAITATLFVTLSGMLAGLVWAFPIDVGYLTGAWIMVPDNGPLCVSTCIACDLAVAVYRMNVMNVQFSVYAP